MCFFFFQYKRRICANKGDKSKFVFAIIVPLFLYICVCVCVCVCVCIYIYIYIYIYISSPPPPPQYKRRICANKGDKSKFVFAIIIPLFLTLEAKHLTLYHTIPTFNDTP